MRVLIAIFIACNLFITSAIGQSITGPQSRSAPLNFTEIDGSPSAYPYKVKVSNGTLTNNGDGSVTITTGGGGGGGITGSGTTNSILKWTNTTVAGDSLAYDNGQIFNYGATTIGLGRFTVTTDGTYGYGIGVNHSPGGVGGCDSNAPLLGHFNGVNGATTSMDANCDGTGAKTFTFSGDAALSTSAAIFGSAALASLGSSGKVTVPDSSSWDITNTYTIFDGKVNITNNAQMFALIGQYQDGSNFQYARYSSAGFLQFYALRGANDTNIAASWVPVNGQTYHLALVRNGATTFTWYVNGVALTNDISNDTTLTSLTGLSGVLAVGYAQDPGNYFNGVIDEVRVSIIARWTSNFTSPTGEYTAIVGLPEFNYLSSSVLKAKTYTDGNNGDRLTFQVGGIDWWYITNAGVAGGVSLTLSSPGTSSTDVPTLSSTSTFTNKTIVKKVVTASDATSITPNSDTADITYQANTQSVGTLTINADGGTPTNGKAWLLKIKSTNVQTFSWNALYVGGTTALPTVTTGSSKIDYFSFIYDTVNSKWQYTGSAYGF